MVVAAGPVRVWGAGLGVVVLWASAFPAIRVAAPELGVVGLSFVRLAVAAVALLAAAPLFGVRRPARRDLPLILACGVTGMTAYQLLLNQGELSVPAGTASILVASAPLVSVGLAAVALGERLTPARLVGSGIAVAGVALVCLSRSGLGLSGAVWVVVGAAVVQGIYHPLTRPLLRTYSGLEVATYAMVAGTLTTAPLLFLGAAQLASASAGAWAAGIYLALLPSALGFVLWGYAVARLPVAASTSLLYLIPAVALLIAFLWLGEVPLPTELLGGAVVVIGVLVLTQGDRLLRQQRPHTPPRDRHPGPADNAADGLVRETPVTATTD
jgi:drug/metabolite transporter (DMT)-like permease